MKTKTCTKCKQVKKLSEFHRDQTHKDGRGTHCKTCKIICEQAYEKTSKGRVVHIRAIEKYNQTFSGKIKARLVAMRQRCSNPKNKRYKCYGKRGIKCLFENTNDLIQHVIADLGVDNVSLLMDLEFHRIDNDGDYERGNLVLLLPAEHRRIHRELRLKAIKEADKKKN